MHSSYDGNQTTWKRLNTEADKKFRFFYKLEEILQKYRIVEVFPNILYPFPLFVVGLSPHIFDSFPLFQNFLDINLLIGVS